MENNIGNVWNDASNEIKKFAIAAILENRSSDRTPFESEQVFYSRLQILYGLSGKDAIQLYKDIKWIEQEEISLQLLFHTL